MEWMVTSFLAEGVVAIYRPITQMIAVNLLCSPGPRFLIGHSPTSSAPVQQFRLHKLQHVVCVTLAAYFKSILPGQVRQESERYPTFQSVLTILQNVLLHLSGAPPLACQTPAQSSAASHPAFPEV